MRADQIKRQARHHLQLGELEPAREMLADLDRQHPGDIEVLALLGVVQAMLEQHDDAVISFRNKPPDYRIPGTALG